MKTYDFRVKNLKAVTADELNPEGPEWLPLCERSQCPANGSDVHVEVFA